MYLRNEAIFELHDKHQTPFWVAPYTVNIIAKRAGKVKWIESQAFNKNKNKNNIFLLDRKVCFQKPCA